MPVKQAPSIVYLNGKLVSHGRARISPDDRGYYFADGVYEVMKYYKGFPFCMEDHLCRLKNSLSGIRIEFENMSEINRICGELIHANQFQDQYAGVYIQITRGVAGRIHHFPSSDTRPSVFIRAFAMPVKLTELISGIRVITREDIRWLRCDIKSIALLPNTMLFQEAVEQNAGECFLIRNGKYTEATHSNIMAVINGTVYTHPDSNLILPGITKKVVIRICKELDINLVEQPIDAEETRNFDECFITGTGNEIMPVISIDERPVGNGLPGTVTRQLQAEFFRITYTKLAGEKISMNYEL